MGSGDSKLHFRKAVIQLTTKTQVGYETCSVRAGTVVPGRHAVLNNVTFSGENICFTYGIENLRDLMQIQLIVMREKFILECS